MGARQSYWAFKPTESVINGIVYTSTPFTSDMPRAQITEWIKCRLTHLSIVNTVEIDAGYEKHNAMRVIAKASRDHCGMNVLYVYKIKEQVYVSWTYTKHNPIMYGIVYTTTPYSFGTAAEHLANYLTYIADSPTIVRTKNGYTPFVPYLPGIRDINVSEMASAVPTPYWETKIATGLVSKLVDITEAPYNHPKAIAFVRQMYEHKYALKVAMDDYWGWATHDEQPFDATNRCYLLRMHQVQYSEWINEVAHADLQDDIQTVRQLLHATPTQSAHTEGTST
jgi:hypothetical protein